MSPPDRTRVGWFRRSARWPLPAQLGVAAVIVGGAAVFVWLIRPQSTPELHPFIPSTISPFVTTTTAGPATSPAAAATEPPPDNRPAAPAPTTVRPGGTAPRDAPSPAIDVLMAIPILNEYRGELRYDRDLFGVWLDVDGNGCDTRYDVLVAESRAAPLGDRQSCHVTAGEWTSAYDGALLTSPSDAQIDHLVALKEAWDSGAWEWSPQRRIAFANDTSDSRSLSVVSASSNSEKGDKDPSNYLPAVDEAVCGYIADWVSVKARWGLSMDESEHGRIRRLLRGTCAGATIQPWPPPSASMPTTADPSH